jgi:mannose-1-phosphate guanylyltransferase/phosphomannomutase
MIKQAVILAGGIGTRMSTMTNNAKCLLNIRGKSLLEWQFIFFAEQRVSSILLLLGYSANGVKQEASDLARIYGVEVDFIVEEKPLGTGGALLNAIPKMHSTFYLTHGDLVLNTELNGLQEAVQSRDWDLALLYHPTNHPTDSDLLVIENHNTVSSIVTKPHPSFAGRCLGNAGIYSMTKKTLINVSHKLDDYKQKLDLDRELIPCLLQDGARVAAVRNIGFVKDVGTPERFNYVELNWEPLMNKTRMRPAIFLDRDGTINRLKGFITAPDQIELVDDAGSTVEEFKRLGYWVIVITNQPVIARGEVSVAELDAIHGKIERDFLAKNTIVDDFFYCPHHPEAGFEGEVSELKIVCKCRKPEVGLIEKARTIYPIDMSRSWMIGDSWRDVQLAKAVGIRSILLSEDGAGIVSADFHAESLTRALEIVRQQV